MGRATPPTHPIFKNANEAGCWLCLCFLKKGGGQAGRASLRLGLDFGAKSWATGSKARTAGGVEGGAGEQASPILTHGEEEPGLVGEAWAAGMGSSPGDAKPPAATSWPRPTLQRHCAEVPSKVHCRRPIPQQARRGTRGSMCGCWLHSFTHRGQAGRATCLPVVFNCKQSWLPADT